MKNKKAFIPAVICAVISVLTTLMFCGFRIGFVFVDHETFDSLSYLLWALFIVNALFWFAHLRSLITRKKTLGKALFIINCVFTFLSVAATVAFLIVGKNEWLNFVYVSFETLPVLAVFYGLVFFIAVFPVCGAFFKKCVAVLAAAACVVSALVYLFPAGGFSFESAPAVFDTGDGYHVVFATNRKSVGYVSYTYGGNDYLIWDTTTGNKDASRVHSIEVPYEHLNGNSYSVNAVRATEEIAYGGHQGKEITYKVEKFTPCPDDDFDMSIITDNHSSRVDWTLIGEGSEIIVLLGDIANGVYSYDIFINNLIVPAGKASMGAVPVIYARGNHDHRGSAINDMLTELSFREYYYRVRIGEYLFTVLDTGEDHIDDYYEYGGYNDYASYVAEQTAWAKTLEREPGYNILIAHSAGLFNYIYGGEQEIASILKDLGIEFSINGHNHSARFISAEDSSTGIASYICGSFVNSKLLNYTVMTFSKGHIDIVSKNTAGEELCTAEFQVSSVE